MAAENNVTLNGAVSFVLGNGILEGSAGHDLVTPGEAVVQVGNTALSWATGDDPGYVNTFWASRLTINTTFAMGLQFPAGTADLLSDFHGEDIYWEVVTAIILSCVDGNDNPAVAGGHAAYIQACAANGWIDNPGASIVSPFHAASTPSCHMTKGSVISLIRPGTCEYVPQGANADWEIVKHPSSSVDAVIDLLLVGRRA